MKPKLRKCKNPTCNELFLAKKTYFNSTIVYPYCSVLCEYEANPQKPRLIPKKSQKQKAKDVVYMKKRSNFLKNKFCPITGHVATEVHHKYDGADRSKYYLDETTWLAVSRAGHQWIHNNPIEAKERGYLL